MSRSIGNQSDFAASLDGESGVGEDELHVRGEDEAEPEPEPERDEHVSQYVDSQLRRVKSRASMGAYEDEFETEVENGGK